MPLEKILSAPLKRSGSAAAPKDEMTPAPPNLDLPLADGYRTTNCKLFAEAQAIQIHINSN
jgi:hypothetical protein